MARWRNRKLREKKMKTKHNPQASITFSYWHASINLSPLADEAFERSGTMKIMDFCVKLWFMTFFQNIIDVIVIVRVRVLFSKRWCRDHEVVFWFQSIWWWIGNYRFNVEGKQSIYKQITNPSSSLPFRDDSDESFQLFFFRSKCTGSVMAYLPGGFQSGSIH